LIFRYNSPILFVNIVFPGKDASSVPAVCQIYPQLQSWYKGNTDMVGVFLRMIFPHAYPLQLMVVDVKLGSRPDSKRKASNKEAQKFLDNHPMAKVVILVDTHSCQDGTIVCGSTKSGDTVYSDFLGGVCAQPYV
jgi:hypothetical protein